MTAVTQPPRDENGASRAQEASVRATPYSQWAVIALAVLLLTLALLFLLLRLLTPFDNGRLQPGSAAVSAQGVFVTPLQEGLVGFVAGDLVTAVEGRSLESLTNAALRAPRAWRGAPEAETIRYTVLRAGETLELNVPLGPYPLGAVLRSNWGTILFALAYLLIAAYLFWRRPQQPAARLLLLVAAALICATTWSLGAQLSDFAGGLGLYLYFLNTSPAFMLVWIATFHFALVFPSPPDLLARRWFVPLLYATPYFLLFVYLLATQRAAINTLDWISRSGKAADVTAAVFLLLALLAVVWQYRRHDSGVTRQQMRWLGLAVLLDGGAALLFYFLPPLLGGTALNSNLIGLLGLLFPIAIAIAILRHNLFDIDTLLNRALVYGALTTVVLLIYILVVGGTGALLQTQTNWFTAVLATGLVALLFQPLRERLQRAVNRLMYGQRDEPFEVLADLGQRLEDTLVPEMVYPTLVETVARTLKLPYVALDVVQGEELHTAVSYGKPAAQTSNYPLIYQGEMVGRLRLAPRGPDEPFSPADERLLRNIARQAGTAVHATQLTVDLQRSHRRLVAAREEERRRLRRDLHDGVGPSLAALHVQSGVLRRLIESDPDQAAELLDELRGDIRATIDEVRRVAYALRPPALDQLGLAAALQAQAERGVSAGGDAAVQVTIEVPALPPLPAAAEVAAYRIVQEALANVSHHAGAQHCRVRLALEEGVLRVEVVDDGRGLPVGYQAGVGLLSMRERAAELGGSCTVQALPGGGTRVLALLPLPQEPDDD